VGGPTVRSSDIRLKCCGSLRRSLPPGRQARHGAELVRRLRQSRVPGHRASSTAGRGAGARGSAGLVRRARDRAAHEHHRCGSRRSRALQAARRLLLAGLSDASCVPVGAHDCVAVCAAARRGSPPPDPGRQSRASRRRAADRPRRAGRASRRALRTGSGDSSRAWVASASRCWRRSTRLRFAAAYPGGIAWLRASEEDRTTAPRHSDPPQTAAEARSTARAAARHAQFAAVATSLGIAVGGRTPDEVRAEIATALAGGAVGRRRPARGARP
jgi:hypothetical protein